MKKQKRKQKRQPVSIILAVICFTVFGYLLVSFISLQVEISAKKAALEELTGQYEQQLAENAELQAVLDGGNEEEYIERIAREQRGYVYPDERVYYDVTPGSY